MHRARPLDARLDGLLERALSAMPRAAGCGLVVAHDEAMRPLVARRMAWALDRSQALLRQGPVVDVGCHDGGAVTSLDLRSDSRWPKLGRELAHVQAPLSAVCLSGIPTTEHQLVLSAYGWGLTPASLSAACERLLVEVQRYGWAYVRDVTAMLAGRRHIEQAKGVVIATVGCSAEEAFQILRRASQRFNVKLRELAVALIELVGAGPAELEPAAVPGEEPQFLAVRDEARWAAENLWGALRAG